MTHERYVSRFEGNLDASASSSVEEHAEDIMLEQENMKKMSRRNAELDHIREKERMDVLCCGFMTRRPPGVGTELALV